MSQGSGFVRTGKRPVAKAVRWLWRGGLTLAVVALAFGLGWLLLRPFLHPRTHLVLLSGDIVAVDPSPGAVPADYVVEDLRELLALDGVLHRGLVNQPGPLILGSLRNPDEMGRLADRLNERVTGRGDVMLIYVSAHGLAQDGDAWLLASGADPQAPLGGRYRLSSLLDQLRRCQAAVKVLILDAGRLDYDPLRGMLDNDFPQRLVEQVEALGDETLWVLASHDAGQRSHLSPALRRSVFGYFVAEGLKGSADANGDYSVDLAELARFVAAGVSGWVRQTTGGASEQTPQLIWGQGTPLPRSLPVLAAVAREADEQAERVDHARSIEVARQSTLTDDRVVARSRSELNSLIASGVSRATPRGRLGQFAGDLARRTVAKATGGAPKLPGALAPAPSADEAKAKEAQAKDDATQAALGEKAPAAKDAKADSAEAKKDSSAAPAKAAPAPSGKSLAAAPAVTQEQLEDQLAHAWSLRDELADAARQQPRPVDHAPHLWRRLEAELLALDRKFRTGFVRSLDEIAHPLGELIVTLQWLAEVQPAGPPPNLLAEQIAASRPGLVLAAVEPRSLALAETIAGAGGPPLPADLPPLVAQLDQLIASGNRTDLERLAAELKPEHDRWLELRLVRRLAARPELDWRLVRLLLAATRTGEHAAAMTLAAPGWTESSIGEADAARLAAERQILARGDAHRDALLAQLTAANSAYQAAAADLAAINSAHRLAHDAWHKLPHYLAWNAAANNAATAGPTRSQLSGLITALDALSALLARPSPDEVAAVRQEAAQLTAMVAEVERGLAPLVIEQLVTAPVSPGEGWRIELLLETPLPTAEIRSALAAALPEVDAALGSQVQAASAASANGAAESGLRADDDRFADRMRVQHQLWQAACRGVTNPDLEALADAWQRWAKPAASTPAAGDVALAALREDLEETLKDLVRGLPVRVLRGTEEDRDLSSPASRGPRLERLRGWDRALRLIDPRSTMPEGAASPAQIVSQAAAYDALVTLRQRARRALEDAPPLDAGYLQGAAEAYRTAAAAIPRQPPLATGVEAAVELSGPQRIALTYEASRQIEFAVRNTSSSPLAVWLVAEEDSQLVAVTSAAQQPIYSWAEWSAAENGEDAGRPPFAARGRPSLELAPGETRAVPLLVVRKKPSLFASHLVLRVVTQNHSARHDVTIELPPPEDVQVTLSGPPGRWSPAPSGLALYPFPNRTNTFALELASGKPVERKIDVEVYPLISLPPRGLPAVPLSAADAQRVRGQTSVGDLVAEARGVVLPPDGSSVPLLVALPKTEAPPAAPPAANGQAPAAPPAAKPPPVPLAQGLVLVITDLADQRQTLKHLDIAPQRPQRYIRPQVRYRAARERIEIKVTAQDPALLPADGVRIHGAIAEPLPPDAERQLDAVLKAPLTEAEMYVEVRAAPGRVVTLSLSVDDYPRAIYYRVPCSGETGDVPEDMDLLAVRIAGLPEGTIYRPPTPTIPVQLQIDAPASALKNPPLVVEVGVDRNRDRELRGDETLMLAVDRQVEAALVGVTKTGELQIATRVSDFTLAVPAGALVSGRVNILAHAVLGEKEAWSEPIEIVSDGQPPRISAVELQPDRVVIAGADLLVSALADDLGLSGVARLEVMFDLDRSGQFGPMAKPVAGALADDGRWAAKLPTSGLSSGAYNVLVRAIDRAGNASEPARASVRLLTAEEAAADDVARNSADISGVVVYGDQPQAGMQVVLIADTGAPPPPAKGKGKAQAFPPPLASATTNAQGQFRFPKVPPGKYVVLAEGLVRNNNRRAEAPVAFAKAAEVQPLTLRLK